MRSFLTVLAAAVILAGCSSAPQTVSSGASADTEVLRDGLARVAPLPDFSAEGSITVNTPTMDQSAGFEFRAHHGDSLMITVTGPFGITVGTALLTADAFTAYNALNNSLYRGSPRGLSKRFPMLRDLPFPLLFGMTQAVHPFPASAQFDSVRTLSDGRVSFQTLQSDGSRDHYTVDPSGPRVTRCARYDSTGTHLWTIAYTFSSVNGVQSPKSVDVKVPAKNASFLLEFDTFERDTVSAPLPFSVPSDAKAVDLP